MAGKAPDDQRNNVIPIRKPKKAYEQDEKDPYLFKSIKTGIYYVRSFKAEYGQLFKTTKQTSKGRAKTAALNIIAEWAGTKKPSSTKTFREAGLWVLEHYTPTQRASTQNNHRIYIGQLIDIIGNTTLEDLSPAALPEILTAIKAHKRYSPRTRKLLPTRKTFSDYSKHLNLVMRHAYQNKWASHRIVFPNPDQRKETGRLMTRSEVTALWKAMNEDTRDQFVLALECVMRLREAICAPWSELNLETGEWTLPPERVKTGSKTGKGRAFIVSPNALARLQARRARMRKTGPWIFPSPTDPSKPIWSTKTAWSHAKKLAGIKGRCKWHDLRHTGLTWLLLGDPDLTEAERNQMIRDPLKVSEYAGVSVKTIQTVYLKRKASLTADVSRSISIY